MTQAFGSEPPEKADLTLGFIPLTDCAPLVVALEQGYFRDQGLQVRLVRESSWASVRDKVLAGVLDGAHMLAPMPLMCALEGDSPGLVTALGLSRNGNAITVSERLFRHMQELDPAGLHQRPPTARGLKRLLARDPMAPALTFATVFPASSHHYLLRYWLAAEGIDPDRDVRLVVVPPAQMIAYLQAGRIDGYCVGEPWNARAMELGIGVTIARSYGLWNNHPEKVFGVSRLWASRYPATYRAVLRSLMLAGQWLEDLSHRDQTAAWLARDGYVGVPERTLRATLDLDPPMVIGPADAPPDALGFPWHSHAAWFLSQMIRWGHADRDIDVWGIAASVYQTDLYRSVAGELGLPCPQEDRYVEGQADTPWILPQSSSRVRMGPNRFCDGRVFDPQHLSQYFDPSRSGAQGGLAPQWTAREE